MKGILYLGIGIIMNKEEPRMKRTSTNYTMKRKELYCDYKLGRWLQATLASGHISKKHRGDIEEWLDSFKETCLDENINKYFSNT